MTKIEKEKHIVAMMIAHYCRHKEGNATLCPSCKALTAYAHARLDHCPFGEAKPACRSCRVHCYEKEKRKRICQVMRYSAPRMFLRMPIEAIKHAFKFHNLTILDFTI